jgi:hypothetical protein
VCVCVCCGSVLFEMSKQEADDSRAFILYSSNNNQSHQHQETSNFLIAIVWGSVETVGYQCTDWQFLLIQFYSSVIVVLSWRICSFSLFPLLDVDR